MLSDFGSQFALNADEVVHAQHHLRMFLERLGGTRVIVLAAHGQQHAALLERHDVFLKRLERLAARRSVADLDPFQAIVRHHAAPERVVQIQNQNFFRRASQGKYQMSNFARQFHEQRGRARLFALKPCAFVAGGEAADAVGEKFQVANMQIRRRI